MSEVRIKACYLRPVVDDAGNPTGEIDIFAHFPEFIDEMKKAQELANANGWGKIRICVNKVKEGGGKFTHKLKAMQ